MKYIINITDIEQQSSPSPVPENLKDRYGGTTMGFIGTRIGAQKLGYNITVVPPGKRAFPFHNHHANEEMFFVLEGEGEIRIGSETYAIKKGDFISSPVGSGVEYAHQIINTSQEELRYLAVSTKIYPELAEYPDSGKFGILAENFRFVGKSEDTLDYWEGN